MHLAEESLREAGVLPPGRQQAGRVLIDTLSTVMHMFYSTLLAAFRERADPIEVLCISALMLCMQQLAVGDLV